MSRVPVITDVIFLVSSPPLIPLTLKSSRHTVGSIKQGKRLNPANYRKSELIKHKMRQVESSLRKGR